MSWLQILGLIAALLLGAYNTIKEWQDGQEAKVQAVESVYQVGEVPEVVVPPPADVETWVPESEPGSLPPTDPGH